MVTGFAGGYPLKAEARKQQEPSSAGDMSVEAPIGRSCRSQIASKRRYNDASLYLHLLDGPEVSGAGLREVLNILRAMKRR